MNTKLAFATVIAFSALSGASAFAMGNHQYGEAANVVTPEFSSSLATRSQVQANYLAARQAGALPLSAEAGFAAPVAASTLSRSDVRMQAAMFAKKDGGSTF